LRGALTAPVGAAIAGAVVRGVAAAGGGVDSPVDAVPVDAMPVAGVAFDGEIEDAAEAVGTALADSVPVRATSRRVMTGLTPVRSSVTVSSTIRCALT
jgi:hypothetical protein